MKKMNEGFLDDMMKLVKPKKPKKVKAPPVSFKAFLALGGAWVNRDVEDSSEGDSGGDAGGGE